MNYGIISRNLLKGDNKVDNIGQLIKQISNRLINDLNQRLKKYGITFSQLQVLLIIKDHHKMCQKDIAKKLKIKHTSLLDILKILERKGLVLRGTNDDNANYSELFLTLEGEEVLNKWDFGKDLTQELMAETLGYASVEEMLSKFKEVLRRLEEGNPNGI